MRSPQPTHTPPLKLSVPPLAIGIASDLAAAYGESAAAAARAGLRQAECAGDLASTDVWTAVCAIFDGEQRVDL